MQKISMVTLNRETDLLSPHVQFWWAVGLRFLVLVSASQSVYGCQNHCFLIMTSIELVMMQKLEPRNADLKPRNIGHVDRVIVNYLLRTCAAVLRSFCKPFSRRSTDACSSAFFFARRVSYSLICSKKLLGVV